VTACTEFSKSGTVFGLLFPDLVIVKAIIVNFAENLDIHLHKALTTGNSVDLCFRPRALKSAKVVEFRKFNEITDSLRTEFS